MLASSNTSQVLHTAMLIFGVLWTFKKVADMERYQSLRRLILTLLLSCLVLWFFVGYVLAVVNPPYTCVINFSDENLY
jgi:hypothetical protein